MDKFFSLSTGSLVRGLTHRLARTLAAVITSLVLIVGSLLPSGLGLIGVSGLAITSATPAHANCLLGGSTRTDISDDDCLEAQRTGCVRHMLTPDQYTSCLKANAEVTASGKRCVVKGKIRNEFNDTDCAEANATGCVRRLLTPTQYRACLDAQP